MKDKLNLMYGLKFDTFNDNIESMIRHINNYGEQVSRTKRYWILLYANVKGVWKILRDERAYPRSNRKENALYRDYRKQSL